MISASAAYFFLCFYVIAPIEKMKATLQTMLNVFPNTNPKPFDAANELEALEQLVNHIVDTIKSDLTVKEKIDEHAIRNTASRLDCEIRTAALAQHYTQKTENSLIESLNRLNTLPAILENIPVDRSALKKQLALLAKLNVDARFEIDQALSLLDRKELPRLQQLKAEPLSHFALVIEHVVATLAERKQLNIALTLDEDISQSSEFIFFDLNAGARFLALALEYWPSKLDLKQTPWRIHVYIKKKINQAPKLCFEFKTHARDIDEDQLIDIQSLVLQADMTGNDPYQKMFGKLQELYHISPSFTFEDKYQLTLGYECDFITGQNISSTIEQYRIKYQRQNPFAIIGDSTFRKQLSQVLDSLYIDSIPLGYDEATCSKLKSNPIPIVIIDFISDSKKAMNVLNTVRQHVSPTPFIVGYAEKEFKEQAGDDYKTALGVDEILSPPEDAISLVKTATRLNCNILVNSALESIQIQ